MPRASRVWRRRDGSFFYHELLTGELAAQVFGTNRGHRFILNQQHSGVSLKVNPGKYGAKMLALVDGQNSFGEIFDAFRAAWKGQADAPGNDALFADFAEGYATLNALERLLLRHPDAMA
jgi:hypothetical protein